MSENFLMNQDIDLITVIIPVYNVSKYLRRCVDSVLNQSYKNIEIILVDDGSTDDSGVICDEYAEKEKSVMVIHQQNQGLGPARNAGLEVMHGDYVGFVDSDDWIEKDMYECMYKAIRDNKCDIATCGRLVVADEGILSSVYCKEKGLKIDKEESIKRFLIQRDMNMSACDKLFKSKLFDDVRFPGEFYISEDIVPMYHLLKKSNGVFLTGKPFYNYYSRIGSLSKSNFSYKTMGACMYAEQVSKEVKTDFPQLADAADYLFYDEVIGIYRVAQRAKYVGKEKKELLIRIKESFRAIMKNPYLYKRQKLFVILALLRIDKLFDDIYITIKQRIQKKHAERSQL